MDVTLTVIYVLTLLVLIGMCHRFGFVKLFLSLCIFLAISVVFIFVAAAREHDRKHGLGSWWRAINLLSRMPLAHGGRHGELQRLRLSLIAMQYSDAESDELIEYLSLRPEYSLAEALALESRLAEARELYGDPIPRHALLPIWASFRTIVDHLRRLDPDLADAVADAIVDATIEGDDDDDDDDDSRGGGGAQKNVCDRQLNDNTLAFTAIDYQFGKGTSDCGKCIVDSLRTITDNDDGSRDSVLDRHKRILSIIDKSVDLAKKNCITNPTKTKTKDVLPGILISILDGEVEPLLYRSFLAHNAPKWARSIGRSTDNIKNYLRSRRGIMNNADDLRTLDTLGETQITNFLQKNFPKVDDINALPLGSMVEFMQKTVHDIAMTISKMMKYNEAYCRDAATLGNPTFDFSTTMSPTVSDILGNFAIATNWSTNKGAYVSISDTTSRTSLSIVLQQDIEYILNGLMTNLWEIKGSTSREDNAIAFHWLYFLQFHHSTSFAIINEIKELDTHVKNNIHKDSLDLGKLVAFLLLNSDDTRICTTYLFYLTEIVAKHQPDNYNGPRLVALIDTLFNMLGSLTSFSLHTLNAYVEGWEADGKPPDGKARSGGAWGAFCNK